MADVTTTFAAKDESFAKTVDNLQKRLTGFQGSVGGFTAAAGGMAKSFVAFAGPLAALAAGFVGARMASDAFFGAVNNGGALAGLSIRTGETAGNLAVLQRAFQNAGASAEQVGPIMSRMQRFMVEASNGGKQQIAVFESLGLSYQQLSALSPTDQMATLARAISGVPYPAQRAAAAMEIFGMSGVELLPLLSNMDSELGTARSQLGSYPGIVDKAASALDEMGDKFKAVSTKAQEFITGALAELAPGINDFLDKLATADFAAWGQKLGEALAAAFNLFKGLWNNPSEIFSLSKEYMLAMVKLMGDGLVSAFRTAVNFLENFLVAAWSGGVLGKIGEALLAAFKYATAELNYQLINAFVVAMHAFERLWWDATQNGSKSFAGELFKVALSFAKDFGQILISPALFIAKSLSSNLSQAVNATAKDYEKTYDTSSCVWIEGVRGDLKKAADEARDNMGSAGAAFGSSVIDATQEAADKTEIVKSNLFGGQEALAAANEHAATIAESAKSTRLEGEGFSAVMATANFNAKAAAKVVIGLAEGMNAASKNVNEALDKMRGAWADGLLSEKERIAMREAEAKVRAAERDKQRAEERADWLEKKGAEKSAHEMRMKADADFKKTMEEIQKTLPENLSGGGAAAEVAMRKGGQDAAQAITEAFSPPESDTGKSAELATEGTLDKVRDLLDKLNTKLPQNALT